MYDWIARIKCVIVVNVLSVVAWSCWFVPLIRESQNFSRLRPNLGLFLSLSLISPAAGTWAPTSSDTKNRSIGCNSMISFIKYTIWVNIFSLTTCGMCLYTTFVSYCAIVVIIIAIAIVMMMVAIISIIATVLWQLNHYRSVWATVTVTVTVTVLVYCLSTIQWRMISIRIGGKCACFWCAVMLVHAAYTNN